jgi:2-keto-3-deoxy-galactonokinase
LVIGAELADLFSGGFPAVTLVGNAGLTARYHDALRLLGCTQPVKVISGESAVIAGQRQILSRLRSQ